MTKAKAEAAAAKKAGGKKKEEGPVDPQKAAARLAMPKVRRPEPRCALPGQLTAIGSTARGKREGRGMARPRRHTIMVTAEARLCVSRAPSGRRGVPAARRAHVTVPHGFVASIQRVDSTRRFRTQVKKADALAEEGKFAEVPRARRHTRERKWH